ncbi:conserved unknown protein [Ectocarpus siliculosus]|uniref:30S ribosomal protein S9 n=1 Tax=Ectocarpus siliculosus TaxID=2880 RepID=D7FTJ8_ECTSI|nr:conserved unknown protein [Ectocarpus siliculosus]|eukprot:CBJ31389.1 conserved unknown protein [Ectocarpus siliculosus]
MASRATATTAMKHPLIQRVMTAAASSRAGGSKAALHSSSAQAGGAAARPTACRHVARGGGKNPALPAPAGSAGLVVSRRHMSSGTTGDDSSSSSGRFSEDLEKLISRAGERADRTGKSGKGEKASAVAVAAPRAAAGEGAGEEEEEDPALSARAMKFRAMISKLRPQKKTAVVKTFTPSREPLVDNLGRSYGLGRRKTSTARVWISLSKGEGGVFMVNSRPMIDYFPRDHLQNEILKPLEYTNKLGNFHVRCTAKGGGQAGQAGAIRLGLARALEAHDPWLRKMLKKEGMMERDSRRVERKKPGLKKARKAPQWVKR